MNVRFCPSVFFYLLSVVPAIWFLELNEMERRIEEQRLRRNKTMTLYRMGNATAYDEFVNTVPVLKVSITQSSSSSSSTLHGWLRCRLVSVLDS